MSEITQERLKELVSYDPDTGVFMRRTRTSNRVDMSKPIGSMDTHGYLWASIDGKTYRLHRLAFTYMTGSINDCDVDHINMNRADNRFSNLRQVSRSVNMQNKRRPSSNNKSGFVGVCYDSRMEKYCAHIRFGGKNRYLGSFETPEAAHAAYVAAKRESHEGGML